MESFPHPQASSFRAGDSVLGLDIGGTKLAAGVVDAAGRLRSVHKAPTPVGAGWHEALAVLTGLAHQALRSAQMDVRGVAGIGIGSVGPLNLEDGTITGPPNLPGWDEVPVRKLIEAEFDRPTFLDNDASAAALASFHWGDTTGVTNLIYLTLSTGVGGAAIIGGQLLRGASGNAAEIGHMTVVWQGRDCACGRAGCVEAYLSGTAIAERAREAVRAGRISRLSALPDIRAAQVVAAAADGDPLACELWNETTSMLQAVLTSLLNLFEPELVVLGGGVTQAGDMLLGPVRLAAPAAAISPVGRAARILITPHGWSIGVLGAAAVALRGLRARRVG